MESVLSDQVGQSEKKEMRHGEHLGKRLTGSVDRTISNWSGHVEQVAEESLN